MPRRAGTVLTLAAMALAVPAAAHAQSPNPLSMGARAQFVALTSFVARSAEKIPESLYSYQPTPEVRTIRQLFGHIADAYFQMCSTAEGEDQPRGGIENGVTPKADLIAALREGESYCLRVMDEMDDQRGTEPVPFYFGPTPRLGVLYFVTTHTYEHYGNLVTYMRLNGIVPPSSETPASAASR
jgi:uncharacterized damage-inducible protein DinB